MKIFLPILVFGLTVVCIGQDSKNLAVGEHLTGKVKSITYLRTITVWKGLPVDKIKLVIGRDIFNADGHLAETSVFGNGEQRSAFVRAADGTLKATVLYFDSDGRPDPSLSGEFTPSFEESKQSDLCLAYTTRLERGPAENIELEREICANGDFRRLLTYEFTGGNDPITGERDLFRDLVEDSRGRSWEDINHFGVDGTFTGFTYTVNNLILPKYTQEISYSDPQVDEHKNRTSFEVKVVNTENRGQVRYQYLEEREITYYPN